MRATKILRAPYKRAKTIFFALQIRYKTIEVLMFPRAISSYRLKKNTRPFDCLTLLPTDNV